MQHESSQEMDPSEGSGMNPPIPNNEAERLEAVTRLNQVHSENQPALIALRNTARTLLRARWPLSGLSKRKPSACSPCVSFPKIPGIPARSGVQGNGDARDCSVCQYTILESDHLVIPDLKEFMDNGEGAIPPGRPSENKRRKWVGIPFPGQRPRGGIELRPLVPISMPLPPSTTRTAAAVGTLRSVDVEPRPDSESGKLKFWRGLACDAGECLEERALAPSSRQFAAASGRVQEKAANGESTLYYGRAWPFSERDPPEQHRRPCRLSVQG